MKRIGILLPLLAVLLGNVSAYALEPRVSARAAIVYDADYGRVLYEHNSREKMLIASTTKIMTAIVALTHGNVDDPVTVTGDMTAVEGSSMYLQAGQTYTLRQLLYGLMLASGNDAATAIAMHIAGDTEAFAELMNDTARQLGLEDTHFENPHGLDGETHYSTAYDMARLMAYAMENDQFAEIAGTRSIGIKNLTYVNHNKLLWQCEGVIGGKTGYTKAAGRTLVTCCEREGQRLICVTLAAPDDWNDHRSLYDHVYASYDRFTLVERRTRYLLPVIGRAGEKVPVEPLTDACVFAQSALEGECVVELPRFVFGPVYRGDRAGRILVLLDGKQIGEVPLVFMENSK